MLIGADPTNLRWPFPTLNPIELPSSDDSALLWSIVGLTPFPGEPARLCYFRIRRQRRTTLADGRKGALIVVMLRLHFFMRVIMGLTTINKG